MNHFANGGFDQSRTCSGSCAQSSARASAAQNPSGSWAARSYTSGSEITAWPANSLGGGKDSCSSRSSSWASSDASAMPFLLSRVGTDPPNLVLDERLLRVEPCLRPDIQLVVGALGATFRAQHRAEPAADEAERDRDDARVRQV